MKIISLFVISLFLTYSFTGLSQVTINDSIFTTSIEMDTLKTKCKTALSKAQFDFISKGGSFEDYDYAFYILENGYKGIFDEKGLISFHYQETDPETGDALTPWQITFKVDEKGNIHFDQMSNEYSIYILEH